MNELSLQCEQGRQSVRRLVRFFCAGVGILIFWLGANRLWHIYQLKYHGVLYTAFVTDGSLEQGKFPSRDGKYIQRYSFNGPDGHDHMGYAEFNYEEYVHQTRGTGIRIRYVRNDPDISELV